MLLETSNDIYFDAIGDIVLDGFFLYKGSKTSDNEIATIGDISSLGSTYTAGNGIDIVGNEISVDPSEIDGYGIVEDSNQRFAIDTGVVVTNVSTFQDISLNVYSVGGNYILEVYINDSFIGEVQLS